MILSAEGLRGPVMKVTLSYLCAEGTLETLSWTHHKGISLTQVQCLRSYSLLEAKSIELKSKRLFPQATDGIRHHSYPLQMLL